jgi:hypothetical protein
MELLRPAFAQSPLHKAMINIGALLDIPTGKFLQGIHGEFILNGGVANITGIAGQPNSFKSTLLHFMMTQAMLRIHPRSTASLYDTELNVHEWRLKALQRFLMMYANIADEIPDLFDQGRIMVTDKTMHTGDEWYEILRDYLIAKRKGAKSVMGTTPFIDRDGVSLMQMIIPTFTGVDSFSQFITQNAMKLQDENSLGESGTNMLNMQQGRAKAQFLMEIPALAQAAYNYVFLTVHVGDEFNMDPHNPKQKKLQHMKQGQKIKGAPENFSFLTNNCWMAASATILKAEDGNGPLYPRDSDDKLKSDTDLNAVTVALLRGKSGMSGLPMQIVISQAEGVLPALTEFNYLRGVKEKGSDKRWGFTGVNTVANTQNYFMDLLPDVKLSRTAARSKIDSDPLLRRALNITSELCQINQLWHNMDNIMLPPAELYTNLKEKGYDWNVLLKTRGWWTIDNDDPKHELPFLSSMDILHMAQGTYHPYWLSEDKKTLKEAYRK